MDKKQTRNLIIAGIIEAVLVVTALVISIIVITTYHSPKDYGNLYHQVNLEKNGPFIGWLQNNPTPFFLIFVLPLLVILAIDIVYLVIYATKKESKISDAERDLIAEQAKAQAREELMKELRAEMEAEAAAEEAKTEK